MTKIKRSRANLLIQQKAGMRIRLQDVWRILFGTPINPSSDSAYVCTSPIFEFSRIDSSVKLIHTETKLDSRLISNLISKSALTKAPLGGLHGTVVSIANVANLGRIDLSVTTNLRLVYAYFRYQSKFEERFAKIVSNALSNLSVSPSVLDGPLGQVDQVFYRRLVALIGLQLSETTLVLDLDELEIFDDLVFRNKIVEICRLKDCIYVTRNTKLLKEFELLFPSASVDCFKHLSLSDAEYPGNSGTRSDFSLDEVDTKQEPEESLGDADTLPLIAANNLPRNQASLKTAFYCASILVDGNVLEESRTATTPFPTVNISVTNPTRLSFNLRFIDLPSDSELFLVMISTSGSRHDVKMDVDLSGPATIFSILVNLTVLLGVDFHSDLGLAFEVRSAEDGGLLAKRVKCLLIAKKSSQNESDLTHVVQEISLELH